MKLPRFADITRNWDDKEKAAAVKFTGFVVAAFTLFILISTVSYIIHWKEDMSLLSNPAGMDQSVDIHNAAGKLGFKTGRLLVCELFGLGSFALLVVLFATSVRLISHSWHRSLLRTTLLCIASAFTVSIASAYVGHVFGFETVFGGGPGGMVGAEIVAWAENLFGAVVTGCLAVILLCAVLALSSKRFTSWFSSIGEGRGRKVRAVKGGPAVNKDDDDEEKEEKFNENEGITETGTTTWTETGAGTEKGAETGKWTKPGSETGTDTETGTETGTEDGNLIVQTDDTLSRKVTEQLPRIDNRLDPPEGLPDYHFPSLDLLKTYADTRRDVPMEELTRNNNRIRAALMNYRIEVTDVRALVGPTVTLYKVFPAPGVKISDIKKLQEDIALSLNAKGVRVIALNDSVGIEVANDHSSIVPLKNLLNDEEFRNSDFELPVAIGYTITQKVKVFDLAEAPHLLIAGATKQGKSVGLNVIISSLLYSKHPSELKFVFIDPKMVEFSAYGKLLHHYLAVLPQNSEEEETDKAIVKTQKDADKVLRSLCVEMDNRYLLLNRAGVQKITQYNDKYLNRHLLPSEGHRFLPYLVVVVDEYADLTMTMGASPEVKNGSRSITNSIVRLAQKGRAAGIHVIIATQRPSVDVISGIIKTNFPMRIAFRVAQQVDSRTILDAPGAEKLIGRGDMLLSEGLNTDRIQCGFIDGDEIVAITRFIGSQNGYRKSYNTPHYLPEVDETGSAGGAGDIGEIDDMFREAAEMVVVTQKGSTSDLQRRLGMGYARAGRVMDQLEKAGVVGPQIGSKPREVLIPDIDSLQTVFDSLYK